MTVRRALLLVLVLVAEYVALETGIRVYGASEGSSTFQSLFMYDARAGHRLQPGASVRYSTVEFTTDITINAQGVRDDEPIGPKRPGERRLVVLGDSLVFAVQVPFSTTFGERLEQRLNSRAAQGVTWRVINAGVQGYGPVHEWLFFDEVVSAFEPDVVMMMPFVANDATEAVDTEEGLDLGRLPQREAPTVSRIRRLARSSVVYQMARLRWDQLRGRLSTGTPERPLAAYLASPPPDVLHGLAVSRRAFGLIADRTRALGARPAIALMPARFQVNDEDFANLQAIVRQAGGELVRQSASARFRDALAPLDVPMMDLQPVLAAQPEPAGVFFQRNVHLTPRGHEVVAAALFDFLVANGLVNPPR